MSVIITCAQENNFRRLGSQQRAQSGTGKLLDDLVLAGVRKKCTLMRFVSQDETETNVTEESHEIAAARVWVFISARFQPQQD